MEILGLIVLLAVLSGILILAFFILKKANLAIFDESRPSLVDLLWPLHPQKIRKKLFGLKCPYCRNAFQTDDDCVQCSVCSTNYHFECSNENTKCTVFGCGGKLIQKQ